MMNLRIRIDLPDFQAFKDFRNLRQSYSYCFKMWFRIIEIGLETWYKVKNNGLMN